MALFCQRSVKLLIKDKDFEIIFGLSGAKMFVYSKKIIQFVHEIKRIIKEVLASEVQLQVGRERFYIGSHSYPISVVIYNHKSLLGYYDPQFYELGFHERLMHGSREQLTHVIKHELAHYMTFIKYGEGVQHHGAEFRAFCLQVGWGEEISKATLCLEEEGSVGVTENAVLRKVQKLMALATSSNSYEAEQAMIKSQQLLAKHNLESFYFNGDEEKIVLKRILKQKKENAKMRAIAKILRTFFVTTVFRRGTDSICLEILGSEVNVEIAEYVATVLEHELERLWDYAREQGLKGLASKNSFFLGIAKGYCAKIDALKQSYNNSMQQALMVIEGKLIAAQDIVYARLSSSQSRASHCRTSSALGEQMGRQLNINPALQKAAKSLALLY